MKKNIIINISVLLTVSLFSFVMTSCGDDEPSSTGGVGEKKSTTYKVNGVSFTMVGVEGGTFNMGLLARFFDSEENFRRVTLSGYSIGQTEVTQELWQAGMGSNPSHFTGNPQRPVENVSWNACQNFISKLNKLTGKNFRLPTEAEWEFAAGGGNKSQNYIFSGSNNIYDVAWFDENVRNRYSSDSPDYGPHAVAMNKPNELGLYDMSGNVFEWCQDWYGPYNNGTQTNPTGPSTGSYRVMRGGSWIHGMDWCIVTNRTWDAPSFNEWYLGLRLAL